MIQKKNILIIEDESAIADTIVYPLTTEGFNPIWCPTGQEGLDIIDKEKIDLIIIDIGLPDINGFELLKKIRVKTEIPAIFLTSRTEELDKVLGLELGADDYITKPFSPRELSARVKAHLRRNDIKDSKVNNKNNSIFVIDNEKKEIKYFDKKVDLSFYEFKILRLFLNNPGHVYSRDKIIEKIWDHTTEIYDRTIDAHVKSIRAKLRAINDQIDPIITHRGFGYSIRENL